MDSIIKEELMRSIATFFFALIGTNFVTKYLGIYASFFTVVGIPLLITGAVFSALVYKRKTTSREFKVKEGSGGWKVSMGFLIFGGIVLIISGIWRILIEGIILMGIFSIVLGLFCILAGLKELRKFK